MRWKIDERTCLGQLKDLVDGAQGDSFVPTFTIYMSVKQRCFRVGRVPGNKDVQTIEHDENRHMTRGVPWGRYNDDVLCSCHLVIVVEGTERDRLEGNRGGPEPGWPMLRKVTSEATWSPPGVLVLGRVHVERT